MVFNPLEDVKVFAVTRPPLIVFVICLSLFGIILMSLAFFVSDPSTKLRDPDISRDWNVFLGNFADIDFCIVDEHNDTISTAASPTTASRKTHSKDTPTTQQTDTVYKNYSHSMLLTVIPTADFLNIPHNVTILTGDIPAHHVGIKGAAGEELISVSMHLPYEWNNTKCLRSGKQCRPADIYACVFFTAPESVFPETESPASCDYVNDTGVEYHARMVAQPPDSMFTPYYCQAKPQIKVHYKLNPSLTMWLSMEDHSAINLHLMHTSYFLFVMVVMILVFALFKGRSLAATYALADKTSSIASSAAI